MKRYMMLPTLLLAACSQAADSQDETAAHIAAMEAAAEMADAEMADADMADADYLDEAAIEAAAAAADEPMTDEMDLAPAPDFGSLQGDWIVDIGDTDGAALWTFDGDTITVSYRRDGNVVDTVAYTELEAESWCWVAEGGEISLPGISYEDPDWGGRNCREILEQTEDRIVLSGSQPIPLRRWGSQ